MNIVIPMAGLGRRFAEAGFTQPKPFVDVAGQPMIQRVVENLAEIVGGCCSPNGRVIFVMQADLAERYPYLSEEGEVVVTEPTRGAVETILRAERIIDDETPLLIANCDQLVKGVKDWSLSKFDDGAVMTFPSVNPAHSYVKLDPQNRIVRIVEKRVLTHNGITRAVVGLYLFRHGHDFCIAARNVLAREERALGEFYVSSVIQEMVDGEYDIVSRHVTPANVHMLGTPEQLARYLECAS